MDQNTCNQDTIMNNLKIHIKLFLKKFIFAIVVESQAESIPKNV